MDNPLGQWTEEELVKLRSKPPADKRKDVGVPKIRSVSEIPSIFTFASRSIEWVIDGILPVASVNALTGGSGDGKTTLAIAMASAIERGEPFAGMETQRRPVLILDRENPLPVIVERYERFGIRDGANFRHWGGWCPEEPPDATSPIVAGWIIGTEPKPIVFVDSFVSMHRGDENDAGEVRAHMQGYRRLADLGATIVILHHSGKGDSTKDYRGSSDFKASLDVGYTATNIGNPSRLESVRLRAFKSRFSVEPEVVLSIRGGEFFRDGVMSANADVLRNLLISNPRVNGSEFEKLAASKSVTQNRARNFLSQGVTDGSVDVESGPRNVKYYSWLGEPKSGLR